MAEPLAPCPIASLTPEPAALGASPFDAGLLAQFADATGRPAPALIRRGFFNAQIDFQDAIARSRSGVPFYIFVSVTPTNRLFHARHILQFRLAKELQDAFRCFVVVHVLDTKACLRDPDASWEAAQEWTTETIKDILSFRFNPTLTIVLKNSSATSLDYVLLCDLQRKAPLGPFFDAFFDSDQASVALLDAVFQNACFAVPRYLRRIFPDFAPLRCLLLLRPSQVNLYHYVLTIPSDNPPPMAIFGGFVPALQSREKMPRLAKLSLTDLPGEGKAKKASPAAREYMSLYLKNTVNEIKAKLNKYAFSGGRDPVSEHVRLGADLDVDIPFFFLRAFESDDSKIEAIANVYGPGALPDGTQRMMSGTLKAEVAKVVGAAIGELQEARKGVTPALIAQLTTLREFQSH
jgi:tryptophanyl-tRNA synthetase